MINASLSYFDAGVIAIMLISCLFAFLRGFVKEILSLGAWIGAGLVTIYYFKDFAEFIQPKLKTQNPIVAAGIATLTLYISSLLVFSIINTLILKFVKEGSDVGVLDNSLGLMFGALRGAFVVSLGYFMLTMLMQEKEYPEWVETAQTRPLVEKGALILAKAAPEYLREMSSLNEKLDGKSESRQAKEEKKSESNDLSAREPAR